MENFDYMSCSFQQSDFKDYKVIKKKKKKKLRV